MHTVKELIEALSRYPDDLEVRIHYDDNCLLSPIDRVKYSKTPDQSFVVIEADVWG